MYFSIYFLVIALSFIPYLFGCFCIDEKHKIVRSILFFISLLACSVFLGIRDATVGVDAMFYGYSDFKLARESMSYFDLLDKSGNEFLYLFIVYISSVVSDDFNVVLASLGCVTMMIYYHSLNHLDIDRLPKALLFVVLMSFFLFHMPNLLRQSLAIPSVMCMLAVADEKRGKLKSLVWMIVALGFHRTSLLVSFPLYIILLLNRVSGKKKILLILATVVFSLLVVILLGHIIETLSENFGALSKYSAYTEQGSREWQKPKVSKLLLLFVVVNAAFVYLCARRRWLEEKDWFRYSMLLAIGFSSILLGAYTASASRLFLFVYGMIIFYMIKAISTSNMTLATKSLAYFFLILYVSFYSIQSSVPSVIYYTSEIIGI